MKSNNMETITPEELDVLVENKFATEINIIHHAYVDIAGDLVAGALLGQIMYWFSPDKTTGRLRVRVKKDGFYWLAKDRTAWHAEIRISPKQYDRAAKLLEDKDLIVKKKYKFDGAPTVHIRPNYENLNNAINEWKQAARKEIVEGVKSILPKGEKPIESTGLNNEVNTKTAETLVFPQRSKSILPKGEDGNSPKVKMEIDERVKSLTEITTETFTENTYIDHHQEIEAAQKQIQQAKQEVSVTQEQNMVVEVKLNIFNSFGIELSNQEITRLIKHAEKHKKNLSEVIQQTKEHFLSTNKPINDLMASLMHGVTNGWNKPKRTVVSKPLPRSIREDDKHEVQTVQPEEDEDLASTYADIQATIKFLRSTEKQVLHNKN